MVTGCRSERKAQENLLIGRAKLVNARAAESDHRQMLPSREKPLCSSAAAFPAHRETYSARCASHCSARVQYLAREEKFTMHCLPFPTRAPIYPGGRHSGAIVAPSLLAARQMDLTCRRKCAVDQRCLPMSERKFPSRGRKCADDGLRSGGEFGDDGVEEVGGGLVGGGLLGFERIDQSHQFFDFGHDAFLFGEGWNCDRKLFQL